MQNLHDVMPAAVLPVRPWSAGVSGPGRLAAMKVLSVNRGGAPLSGPVAIGRWGHAGAPAGHPGRALWAYPVEHYTFWQTVRAQAKAADWGAPLAPGAVGEDLTIEGLVEERLWVGDFLVFPGCVLAVSEPRFPTPAANDALGFRHAEKLMWQSGFTGGWLGVIEPGAVEAGQAFTLRPGPRDVNLRDLFRARSGA